MLIKDFPNYRVDISGVVTALKITRPDKRVYKEKQLKPNVLNTGYATVLLYNGEFKKRIAIHRLVAEAFIPNPENKPCVNHKDGNKLNNHVDNLEWVSYSENGIHAFSSGLSSTWNKGLKSRSNRFCFCGNSFYPRKAMQKFCSKSCAISSRYHLLENAIISPQKTTEP